MKTVHARKVESNIITIGPIAQRIRYAGVGRKRFMDNKRKPGRAAQKRAALKDLPRT